MERKRKLTEPKETSNSNPRGPASRVFARRKIGDRTMVTHESLAEDLACFRRGGGVIEVLGTTLVRRNVGQDGALQSSALGNERKRRN
jgi:hypothetical protein